MNLTALKSNLTSSVLACSLALVAFAPGSRAIAQNSTLHVIANVPFDFQSGSEMMPAGRYDIQQLSNHILIVRGTNQPRSQFLLASNAETLKPSDRGKLVFHRCGNRYFLYQIWSPGNSSGFELPESHAEREAVRAANYAAPSTSELALSAEPKR
jgi:hypothetical protein